MDYIDNFITKSNIKDRYFFNINKRENIINNKLIDINNKIDNNKNNRLIKNTIINNIKKIRRRG